MFTVSKPGCSNISWKHFQNWEEDVYMDGVVREVNVRVLGKGLELLSANGGRFEI